MHERANVIWAERLGCSPELLQTEGVHFIAPPHPDRCFVLSTPPATIVAVESSVHQELARCDQSLLLDPVGLARLLRADPAVVGPAFVGYSTEVREPSPTLEVFSAVESRAFAEIESALSHEAWSHANLEAAASPIFAVMRSGSVVSAAGAETVGGRVGHIGVATHPAHRGRGFARQVVGAAAFAAHKAGLLPQFQTLFANEAAMAVGRALGFAHYATTLSARWGAAAN